MPSINHTADYVSDLERSRAFYATYLGGTAGGRYHNPRTGLQTYFFTFDEGSTRLELMTRPELAVQGPTLQLGWNQFAFSLGSKDAVDALTARLRADGYTVISGPRTTGDGYY